MSDIDQRVQSARADETLITELIEEYRPFILSSAGAVCGHHITDSDDEWSIALLAFYDSVKSYDPGRGHFISYARIVIRSRLTDYFRSQNKDQTHISLEDLTENETPRVEETNRSLREEIEALDQTLSNYGFTYLDLISTSPKAHKTRSACARAVLFMLESPLLISNMRTTGLLPVKIIEKNSQVPRKILERHRKYIVTAVEILSGDYPQLSEYMEYIRKEGAK